MKKIIDYFDLLFPNPKPELTYNSDFEFLIAVVLSAQSTDIKVNKVTKILFSKYDINSIKDEYKEDIINILKPLGMSKKKASYIIDISKDISNKYNNIIPNNRDELMKMNGVGRKTANVVLAQLYNKPYIGVDTHISRVSKRIGLAKEKDTVLTIENKLYKLFPKEKYNILHIQMVLFGRYYCKAKKPRCNECELKDICKYYEKKDK